jgi:alpha-glucosidase
MKPWLLAATFAFFCVGGSLRAQEVRSTPLVDGISVASGAETVELRVASPEAFRLRISPSAAQSSSRSVYLRVTPPAPASFTTISEGSAVGIKTDFGELLVDPATKKWTLRDVSGNTLADWASWDEPNASGTQQEPALHLAAGASPTTPHPLFYGSGNVPAVGSLVQREVHPATGNGRAGLPQYWSTAHYGALMVGDDDNRPASWKANPAGSVDWIVPGDSADLYLMPSRNLYEWLRADAGLTGFAPVPPRWIFGYLQSRWGWTDRAYLEETLAHFRRDQLPVDAFILDFEWYTTKPDYSVGAAGDPGFVDFGWNAKLLPDPAAQLAAYRQEGLRVIGIRKPRLGNSGNLAMARDQGWILPLNPHDPNGGAIRSRNLDFSRAEARAWWEEKNRKFIEAGLAAFWNDEGETNYIEYSYWNMAEVDLLNQVRPGARFWSLNRSFIPGMQRFGAAVWTGDIGADWKTLARTPGELLSDGLSGMPYSTCDIGGFHGPTAPDLLARWMEAGVFFPVMRSHSRISDVPHFPWLFGEEAEGAIRKALDLRYRLLPYFESLAHEANGTGAPIMRPLVMEFPDDPQVANLTSEWLVGTGLLAAPILSPGTTRQVYLPNGSWFDFSSNHATQGPQTIPVTSALDQVPIFVRAGTLLPLGPVRQYTGQLSDAPLELQIYPGRDASFVLVEDDGATLAYAQPGGSRRTAFSWNDQTRTLTWKVTGGYVDPSEYAALKAVLFSVPGPAEKAADLGKDGSLSFP